MNAKHSSPIANNICWPFPHHVRTDGPTASDTSTKLVRYIPARVADVIVDATVYTIRLGEKEAAVHEMMAKNGAQ